jgi:hypothetical protein
LRADLSNIVAMHVTPETGHEAPSRRNLPEYHALYLWHRLCNTQ